MKRSRFLKILGIAAAVPFVPVEFHAPPVVIKPKKIIRESLTITGSGATSEIWFEVGEIYECTSPSLNN